MLWRVFEVDGLACACGGCLVLQAVVPPRATVDVLDRAIRPDTLGAAPYLLFGSRSPPRKRRVNRPTSSSITR